MKPLIAEVPGPEVLLVLAPDRPLKIDAPGDSIRIEVDRAKWKRELDSPSEVTSEDLGVPDAVPLTIAAAGCHQGVSHQAGRVHFEEVSGLLVEERVHDPHQAIVGPQEFVALHRVAEHALGLGIEVVHAHVQIVAVEDEAHLRAFGGCAAENRILLNEISGGHGALPDRLVQHAVENDRLALDHRFGSHGAAARLDRLGLILAERSHGTPEHDQADDDVSRVHGCTPVAVGIPVAWHPPHRSVRALISVYGSYLRYLAASVSPSRCSMTR